MVLMTPWLKRWSYARQREQVQAHIGSNATWLSLRVMSNILVLKPGYVKLQQPSLVMGGRGLGLLGLLMQL